MQMVLPCSVVKVSVTMLARFGNFSDTSTNLIIVLDLHQVNAGLYISQVISTSHRLT